MKSSIRRACLVPLALGLLSVILLSPGLPWSAHCRYALKRISMRVEAKIAAWRGQQPRPVSLSGRLMGTGAFLKGLKGAQVVALESTSGYAAMTDGEGRFTLPHLTWYPGATYTLFIAADIHRLRRLEIIAPPDYPSPSTIDVGELQFDKAIEVPPGERYIRHIRYDNENSDYYRDLFERLTANAKSDHQKIDAISRYVATRHNPKENAWSFKSARQILERGGPHCSNLAFAMAAITAAGGYPTRTVHTSNSPQHINTHVVVEVYYEDGWHLYDPTYGVFFLNEAGAVASYKQLRLAPGLITPKAFQGLDPGLIRSVLEWMPGTYSSGLHQIYYASEDAFTRMCPWLGADFLNTR